MERDTDLERIWDAHAGNRFVFQKVYPLYDLMLMGLWWQATNATLWDVERVIEWMAENPHRVGD